MDQRVRKTTNSIYRAFGECLKEKDYASLSVEDILRKAGVSRSTFYAHFKTKDDVLDSVSRNIFHHVFSHSLQQEETHDFSHDSILEYTHLFTHILYHLRDDKDLIQSVLRTSCRQRFLDELRLQVRPLVERCVKEGFFPKKDVPDELRIRHGVEGFATLISYWFECGCDRTPEEMVASLLELQA